MGDFRLRIIGDIYVEVWKDVDGYEGRYQVSNYGRVRSTIKRYRYLSYKIDRYGYYAIALSYGGKMKHFTVHRLVAQAFLPKWHKTDTQVNHKNEIKIDNRVENLEWCNAKYNSNYGTRIERVAEHRKKPILQYSTAGEFIKEWDSATDAARFYNKRKSDIYTCCKGKQQTAYGYKWKYKEEAE